jgi:iron complex transport system substrate-binding protein
MAHKNIKALIPIILIAVAFALSYAGQRALHTTEGSDTEMTSVAGYRRIVSLAPSITETLYALELDDRVVGVTSFCDYPPDATTKTSVGGIIDTNYEAIVHLEPDVVILLPVHHDAQIRLKELGINTLTVDCRTLDGILDSISSIGAACQVPDHSDAILADIHRRMHAIQASTEGLDRPTVLVSAGRSQGSGPLSEVYAAGKGQWYDDLIHMAGGANVFTDEGLPFPSVTGEGLVRLNPDVIVEMAPASSTPGVSPQHIIAQWDALPSIAAVRDDRVYVLDGSYTTIPGPRFVNIIEDLARVLHPDVAWDTP